MTTQRRAPNGQGPSRRPTSTRVRTTGSTRVQSRTRARPAPTRRTVNVGTNPAKRTSAPRPRALTGRATVLIVVFVALALAYTYPLRVYLAQESQIEQMENQQRDQRQRIQDLNARVAQWGNDDFVIAQAASRLHLVPKGHLLYVVGTEESSAGAKTVPADEPWYDQVRSGIQAADNPPPAKPR